MIFTCFSSSLFTVILKKKQFYKRIHTQSRSVERRICSQIQDLQVFKKIYMSQRNPKEVFHTAYLVQLHYVALSIFIL